MCLTFTNIIPLILLHRSYNFQLPADVMSADKGRNGWVSYLAGGFLFRVFVGFFVVVVLATLALSVLSSAAFDGFPSESG